MIQGTEIADLESRRSPAPPFIEVGGRIPPRSLSVQVAALISAALHRGGTDDVSDDVTQDGRGVH
jgi:hypothetical protein